MRQSTKRICIYMLMLVQHPPTLCSSMWNHNFNIGWGYKTIQKGAHENGDCHQILYFYHKRETKKNSHLGRTAPTLEAAECLGRRNLFLLPSHLQRDAG